MRILILGGGAREHALGWKLAQSDLVTSLTSAPGNPGLAELGEVLPELPLDLPEAVTAEAARRGIDLVVIGPEAPLAAGVVDALEARGIRAFGPSREAARLEWSKSFAKEVMARAGVPTAAARIFDDPGAAKDHLAEQREPYVVKADGLAGGKGVLVTHRMEEATAWVDRCFAGAFGQAGRPVVIEEHLDGPELSVLVLCDGREVLPLPPARDYKRLQTGDEGPNTGGMGCYSPVPDLPGGVVDTVVERIALPVIQELAAEGISYRGVLYVGLVLTDHGPKVLEFNCRLGDPEAQVVLPRLQGDLATVLLACTEGELVRHPPRVTDLAAVDVVLASPGYPEAPRTGQSVHGLEEAGRIPGVLIFHAGTAVQNGRLVTAGGRILNVVGTGEDLSAARDRAYRAAALVEFPGRQFRSDVAQEVAR